jgi:hypothetical protein
VACSARSTARSSGVCIAGRACNLHEPRVGRTALSTTNIRKKPADEVQIRRDDGGHSYLSFSALRSTTRRQVPARSARWQPPPCPVGLAET